MTSSLGPHQWQVVPCHCQDEAADCVDLGIARSTTGTMLSDVWAALCLLIRPGTAHLRAKEGLAPVEQSFRAIILNS
eukprot:2083210-Amphidinium_carterae.1